MAYSKRLYAFLAMCIWLGGVHGDVCQAAAGSVFINEFHYENIGADVNEAVELAAPAGLDLSGLTVVLYNGGTASAATAYNTRSLSQATMTSMPGGVWQLAVLRYPSGGIQNGPNDAIAIVATCANGTQQVLQFICYEGAASASSGPAAGLTCTNVAVSESTSTPNTSSLYLTGTGSKASDFIWTSSSSTFGALNTGQILTTPSTVATGPSSPATWPAPCDSTSYTHIGLIQGASTGVTSATPMPGPVSTIGIVVGTSFGSYTRRGFWVTDPNPDNDPRTSDGIFVYVGSMTLPYTPSVGDLVLVAGSANETNGNTQITLSQVTKCASGIDIQPYVSQLDSLPSEDSVSSILEPLEGMRVNITAPNLRVADTYQLGRYGKFVISQGDLIVPTQLVSPGAAAAAMLAGQQYIQLDDSSSKQNPDPVIYPAPQLSEKNTLRVGYSVLPGFEAVVVQVSTTTSPYYVLIPINASSMQFNATTSPRLGAQDAPMASDVRVVSTNVLNLFKGPPYPTARGADTEAEYIRQVTKVVNAIAAMQGDIVGVIEVANDGYGPNSTIANLTALLNDKLGNEFYRYIDPGHARIGKDFITCKILYNPANVAPVGRLAVLNSSVNSTFLDVLRPTQAQTFTVKSTGNNFTFVLVHLKSKGSACTGDPDTGDGQGNCAGVRKAAAAAMVTWLARDPTGTNATDYLIMGDFNAYAREDAVMELIYANYTNLIEKYLGPHAYSFIFDARKGYLDHALASSGMVAKVVNVAEWHINAAEPTVFDYHVEYKTATQDALYYSPEPVRYSDHDPVIVDLCFTDCALRANATADGGAAAVSRLANDTGNGTNPKATMFTSKSDGLPEPTVCRWLLSLFCAASLLLVGNRS